MFYKYYKILYKKSQFSFLYLYDIIKHGDYMDLQNIKWNKKTYKEFVNYLESLKNEKNSLFGQKLIKTKYEILGLKTPDMKNIIKEILKGDYESFLKVVEHNYYEEIVIEGGIINNYNFNNEYYILLENYLPFIDNWATCDVFCYKNKKILNNSDKNFNYFYNLAKDKREYYCRMGLIMILGNFVLEEYIDKILLLIDSIESDLYYVNMAQAWLLCDCYIKSKNKTSNYLLKNKLNKFTYNKAISKMCDSFRVSDEDKKYLKTIRRK